MTVTVDQLRSSPAWEYPDDPGALDDEQKRELEKLAAGLIRTVLWRGRGCPQPSYVGGRWSMGRELSVWKQLAPRVGPVSLNGAILVAREALSVPATEPLTMLIFNGRGKAQWLRRCVQHWERQQVQAGDLNKAGAILRDVMGAK